VVDRATLLRGVLERAVAAGITPGAVASVRREAIGTGVDGEPLVIAAGTLASHERAAALRQRSTDPSVHYDLASLTKVLATTTLWARAVSEGRASLEDLVPDRWRAATGDATLADLLAHRGGLEAHREFFVGRRPGDRAALLDAVAAVPRATEVGPVVYSDLGFIILGHWVEQVLDRSLRDAFDECVATPLGLHGRIGYRDLAPPVAEASRRIAPTEVYDPSLHEHPPSWFSLRSVEGMAHGRVHDDNAVIAGGVAGHAGLFGDVGAVDAIAHAWADAPDRLGINPAVRDRFWAPAAGTRRLGWDGPNPDGSGSTGRALSSVAVGHLGYTGTSVWVDPGRSGPSGAPSTAVYVLLTNRVHPTREEPRIAQLRREFHAVAAG
jgi:CubicO group peptidase (beta-lactamase class C family)